MSDASGTYNGSAFTHRRLPTGADRLSLGTPSSKEPIPANLNSLLNLGSSFTDVPGGTANWTFFGNNDYNSASGSVAIVIGQAGSITTVSDASGTYNGVAFAASATVTGAGSLSLGTSSVALDYVNISDPANPVDMGTTAPCGCRGLLGDGDLRRRHRPHGKQQHR